MATKHKVGTLKTTLKACLFSQASSVTFAEGEEKDNEFHIVGYSGQIIPDHWYWGNVAFDLGGMKFASKKTPVLDSHWTSARVGFSTKQEITDKVTFEGRFLTNEDAQRLRGDIKEGFPMQASLYVPPSVIEFVKEGETSKVNGHTLKGPGAIFRKSVIKEVSMCVFGADSNTQSKAFAEGGKQEIEFKVTEKEKQMAETTEITAETIAADNPELYKQVTETAKAEGEKKVRDEFAAFCEKFKDDPELIVEQFAAGNSITEAVEAQNTKLKDANKKLAEAAKASETTTTTATVDPAEQEFTDDTEAEATTAAGGDTEEAWRAEFAKSKKLQDEFGTEGADDYVAFKKADAKNLVTGKV